MYQVVLIGVHEDFARSQVVKNLATLFKTTPEQVSKLLESSGYVVKKGISQEIALKYKAALEAAGVTCRIDEELILLQTLDVDLPTETPKILIETQPQSGAIPVPDAKKYVQNRMLNILRFIVLFACIMWVGKLMFFPYSSNTLTPSTISTPLPESLLDKITIIGKSTREEFSKFRDEGGINTNPIWHGLLVSSVEVNYKGGFLSFFQLKINGKPFWVPYGDHWIPDGMPTPKQTRILLSSICGIDENAWSVNDIGGTAEIDRNGKKFVCLYTMEGNQIKILIGYD